MSEYKDSLLHEGRRRVEGGKIAFKIDKIYARQGVYQGVNG